MKYLNLQEPNSVEWKAWIEQCSSEQQAVNDCVAAGEKPKIKSEVYSGKSHGLKESYFISPNPPFYGKCAFCEQVIHGTEYGDIEHYRPKGGVTTEDYKPIDIVVGGETKPHPGYYWLCYDWTNLLPSCEICNRPSERGEGKRNKFPVQGTMATSPDDDLKLEQPLIINPMFEDPSDHLFVTPNGIMHPKNGSVRGAATIRILGLNLRDLPGRRARAFRKAKRNFRSWKIEQSQNDSLHEDAIAELLDECQRDEFVMVSKTALKEFLDECKSQRREQESLDRKVATNFEVDFDDIA